MHRGNSGGHGGPHEQNYVQGLRLGWLMREASGAGGVECSKMTWERESKLDKLGQVN